MREPQNSAKPHNYEYRRDGSVTLDVASTWDGLPIEPQEMATVTIRGAPCGLVVCVDAPYFSDPAPAASPGSTDGLWEREVVELFVAERRGARYLEIELGPHGHYLVLTFDALRHRDSPPHEVSYQVTRCGPRWRGEASIPARLLPPVPHRINAYAIHGGPKARRYLAMMKVPGEKPDFHRLDCFCHVDLPTE